MIKTKYDSKRNTIIIDFEGRIDMAQAEPFSANIQKILLKVKKGFTLLTDLSLVEHMDIKVKDIVTKHMELFNTHGIAKVIRVIPDPAKDDIGFNILSVFHYSKEVKFITVLSRQEAEAHLIKP